MLLSRRQTIAASTAALALPGTAFAQSKWPERPVTFVVGYAAGGGADIVARELAQLTTPLFGQSIIIDNKGGAAGGIGASFVANAKPDGYTLFYAVGTNIVLNPHVLKGYKTNTLEDLVPIVQTTDYQYVLAVHPDVPAKNVAELVALAKKDPEKLTYSSSGAGGNNHLAGALFSAATGVKMTHVPYKGTGPALLDVINGVITMNFSSLPPAVSQIKAGRLRALAVTGTKRVSALPDVPTLEETGIKGATLKGWHGLLPPRARPPMSSTRSSATSRRR
jgi:tripartite-type tricarboxylate transporter receptor subunit TctC